MRVIFFLPLIAILLFPFNLPAQAEQVAVFKGQQVTGVTVSTAGRIFANFPRWRNSVEASVVETAKDGTPKPYPDDRWNSWQSGAALSDSVFVAVQSVVAFQDDLYVLDTRNPLFQGVQGSPVIFVFDLETDQLKRSYPLGDNCFHPDSYINDLRVDPQRNMAYFTDSGNSGLVVLNLETGECRRILDDHASTEAETTSLQIDGKAWTNKVHSDGIALDTDKDLLYFHALTGYTLYALPLLALHTGNTPVEDLVQDLGKTPAPDGMITDQKGNLYMADLENHKIVYRDPKGELHVLLEGEDIRWADTFSIHDGYLYYTNSRIHEAGEDISNMEFQINKVPLP